MPGTAVGGTVLVVSTVSTFLELEAYRRGRAVLGVPAFAAMVPGTTAFVDYVVVEQYHTVLILGVVDQLRDRRSARLVGLTHYPRLAAGLPGPLAGGRPGPPLPCLFVNTSRAKPAIAFRTARPDDVTDVVALVESAYRGDSGRQGWTTEADLLEGQRTDEASVTELIRRPDSLLLLAKLDDNLAGCCHLARRDGDRAYFGMFAVAPELQGTGLGGAVLAEAERTARDRWGAGWLRMTVISRREELLAWYRRRGYEPTGETEPFPYGDERFGIPLCDDLEFLVLEKPIG